VDLARRIRGTEDLSAIIGMLDEALVETQGLGTAEALTAARLQTEEAERSIQQLRDELEQVKSLLHEDPLTGVLNRRGTDEAFRREAARSDRHGGALSIALIDLDNFKALNDTLGHPAGDRALKHVAQCVRSTLRPNDIVGRFGGEEFLVLLPDTGLASSAAVLSRIRRELARRPLPEQDITLKITFSAGIAERVADEPMDRAIARADAALYRAKRAGKNRVALAR